MRYDQRVQRIEANLSGVSPPYPPPHCRHHAVEVGFRHRMIADQLIEIIRVSWSRLSHIRFHRQLEQKIRGKAVLARFIPPRSRNHCVAILGVSKKLLLVIGRLSQATRTIAV